MTEFKDIKKVLIIKLRHIGDVLLAVPAIRAVRETFPDAYIAALVNAGTEEVLTENPLLSEVMIYDREIKKLPLKRRLKRELEFLRELRSRNFDMTIDLTSGDRPAIYSYLSGARYRLAYDPERKGFIGKRYLYTHLADCNKVSGHTIFQNLHLVEQFWMDTKNLKVEIFYSKEDETFVDSLLIEGGVGFREPFVHIHPTSRWLFKCWKDEYMAEVIRWLIGRGLKVVITSSPDKKEMERAKKILSLVSPLTTHNSQLVNLCGKTTLKHLAVLSKKARLFLGVDSAPMHIAAAVGTPVVALFGPSGVFDWGPWDNNGSKLESPYAQRNGIQTFGRHTVIQRDWDCIPCGKDGCNGSKKSECLDDIKIEEVLREIRAKVDLSEAAYI